MEFDWLLSKNKSKFDALIHTYPAFLNIFCNYETSQEFACNLKMFNHIINIAAGITVSF